MIKNINQACHKLNKALGISLKLPEPGQNALRAAALLNFGIGVGLLAIGLSARAVWCAVLGGLVLAGCLAMWRISKD